jgi:hypothetical protein
MNLLVGIELSSLDFLQGSNIFKLEENYTFYLFVFN